MLPAVFSGTASSEGALPSQVGGSWGYLQPWVKWRGGGDTVAGAQGPLAGQQRSLVAHQRVLAGGSVLRALAGVRADPLPIPGVQPAETSPAPTLTGSSGSSGFQEARPINSLAQGSADL